MGDTAARNAWHAPVLVARRQVVRLVSARAPRAEVPQALAAETAPPPQMRPPLSTRVA